MKKCFLIIFLFLSFFSFAKEDKKIVAVLPFVCKGDDNVDVLSSIVTSHFISSITINGTYNVVERTRLNRALEELQFQKKDIFDEGSTKEIGRMTGANIVIIGNVIKFRDNYYLFFRGIDLEMGVALFANRTTFSNKDDLMVRKSYDLLLNKTDLSKKIDNSKQRVAIPLFGSKGNLPKNLIELISEIYTAGIIEAGKYNVVERGELDKAMAEAQFQMKDLFDKSKVSKMGALKGANIVIAGEVMLFQEQYIVSVNGIEIESGLIPFSESNSDTIENEYRLIYVVDEMANRELGKERRADEKKRIADNKSGNVAKKDDNKNNSRKKYDETGVFNYGVALVSLNGKYGFIDKTGREVVPLKYDDAWGFSEGFARVKLNDKWGFINKNYYEIVPPKYDYVLDFIKGLAKVGLNGKWGFINTSGEEITHIIYDEADNSGRRARVKLNNQYYYVDRNGQLTPEHSQHYQYYIPRFWW